MKRGDLVDKVIMPVLQDMGCYSRQAVDLLIMIAAHESRRGYYLHQVRGPAVGIFQMEPATHDDIIAWMEARRPELLRKIFNWTSSSEAPMMAGNLYYAAFMARAFFLRFPEPIPVRHDLMAEYAKWYWNTTAGKAVPADYLKAFNTWK